MPDPRPLVLAIGDSLVAGYGLSRDEGFAGQLQARLCASRPSARIVDEGRSGDTTGAVFERLPRALSRLPARPDLAVVQVGPNDVLRSVPPPTTRANLDAILTELGRCGVPTLLTTVAPPPVLLDRARAYVGLHAELAEEHGAVLHPFFPPGVLGHPDMVLADRVHPNARAIALVVDALLPAVERLLSSGGADRSGRRGTA